MWRVIPAMLVFAACATAPEGTRFIIEVSGERFAVIATDSAAIEALEARRQSGVAGVISGELRAGDGNFNDGWRWHLAPETVHAPDLAAEVCDGRPSFVEDDLRYWLDAVGRFCPWGAKVVGRT